MISINFYRINIISIILIYLIMVTALWVSFCKEGKWSPRKWTHPRVTAKQSCPHIIPLPRVHGDLLLAFNQWTMVKVIRCYSMIRLIMLHYVWPCQDPGRKMLPCICPYHVEGPHCRELWMACRNRGLSATRNWILSIPSESGWGPSASGEIVVLANPVTAAWGHTE